MGDFRKKRKAPAFLCQDVISIFNRRRAVLEGVECIVFCDSEKIIVKKHGTITLLGEKLCLEELGNDNIAVCGSLHSLVFGEEL